jgi:hypothetical protein
MKSISATKRNKLLIDASAGLNLKGLILSLRSPPQRVTSCKYCISMTFQKRKNSQQERTAQCLPGFRGEEESDSEKTVQGSSFALKRTDLYFDYGDDNMNL